MQFSHSQPVLKVKRLSEFATLPKRGSAGAAGFDLYSADEKIVPARGRALIKTDISIVVPTGNYGRIAPRSGLALKNFLDVGAGVIDEDYRGEVGVLLFNFNDQDYQVHIGDRIAQLIIEKITYTTIEEVDALDQTERGEGGFGSTGISLGSALKENKSIHNENSAQVTTNEQGKTSQSKSHKIVPEAVDENNKIES